MTVTFLFVVLSDITPEEKRADAFLRAGAFSILAALVMPPLAAWLMNYNPWLVFSLTTKYDGACADYAVHALGYQPLEALY